MQKPLVWGSIFRRNELVANRRVGDETVLVPIASGVGTLDSLYTLNQTAGFVWQASDGTRTAGDILQELLRRYDVGEAQARTDLESLLSDLTELNFIEVVSRPPPLG